MCSFIYYACATYLVPPARVFSSLGSFLDRRFGFCVFRELVRAEKARLGKPSRRKDRSSWIDRSLSSRWIFYPQPSFCRLAVAKCIFVNALLEPASSALFPLADSAIMCLICYVRFLFDFFF
jgi:hypothetical protein